MTKSQFKRGDAVELVTSKPEDAVCRGKVLYVDETHTGVKWSNGNEVPITNFLASNILKKAGA